MHHYKDSIWTSCVKLWPSAGQFVLLFVFKSPFSPWINISLVFHLDDTQGDVKKMLIWLLNSKKCVASMILLQKEKVETVLPKNLCKSFVANNPGFVCNFGGITWKVNKCHASTKPSVSQPKRKAFIYNIKYI